MLLNKSNLNSLLVLQNFTTVVAALLCCKKVIYSPPVPVFLVKVCHNNNTYNHHLNNHHLTVMHFLHDSTLNIKILIHYEDRPHFNIIKIHSMIHNCFCLLLCNSLSCKDQRIRFSTFFVHCAANLHILRMSASLCSA